MPTYGRSFQNTDGMGKSYQGTGKGTWQTGVYDFKVLPLDGSKEMYDSEVGATYSYDSENQILVSYDTAEMAKRKAQWIRKRGLGGGMWWESSADKQGVGSLITTVWKSLVEDGVASLKAVPNLLDYPESLYDNVKKGFPGE